MKAKCENCGYEWDTKSKLIHVVCPSCRKLVKLREKNIPSSEATPEPTARYGEPSAEDNPEVSE